MSIIAPTLSLAKAQTKPDPRAHWITPEEQLKRLPSHIAEIVSSLTPLIDNVANIVAVYTDDEPLTHWYKALNRLNALPKKIPPLPWNIGQILNSKCPIYSNQKKEDGTSYKIRDTHFLSLVPKEFGSLNHLEKTILKPYGEKEYPKGKNPLRFGRIPDGYGEIAFPKTHWVLLTNTALPGSWGKTWNQQIAQVGALRKKAFVNYEIPSLQDIISARTTNLVATGDRRCQSGGEQDGTATRVKELTGGYPLFVGGPGPHGVYLCYDGNYANDSIGVAALRLLPCL